MKCKFVCCVWIASKYSVFRVLVGSKAHKHTHTLQLRMIEIVCEKLLIESFYKICDQLKLTGISKLCPLKLIEKNLYTWCLPRYNWCITSHQKQQNSKCFIFFVDVLHHFLIISAWNSMIDIQHQQSMMLLHVYMYELYSVLIYLRTYWMYTC